MLEAEGMQQNAEVKRILNVCKWMSTSCEHAGMVVGDGKAWVIMAL